jgi:hypothetical protein
MIGYIDELEANKPKEFQYDSEQMVYLEFGKDVERPTDVREIELKRHSMRTLHDLDTLDEQPRAEVVEQFNRVIREMQNAFGGSDELYVNEFRMAKYYPGGSINLHSDHDEGFSSHLSYSSIVYLNTMTKGGGKISFVDHGYTYCPEEGDLIIFPCKEGGYHEVDEVLETRYSLAMWVTKQSALALY